MAMTLPASTDQPARHRRIRPRVELPVLLGSNAPTAPKGPPPAESRRGSLMFFILGAAFGSIFVLWLGRSF